jgi:hypothetical protein
MTKEEPQSARCEVGKVFSDGSEGIFYLRPDRYAPPQSWRCRSGRTDETMPLQRAYGRL